MADSGYGTHHHRLRKQLLPYAYGRRCHFCGDVMRPGQALDLDHSDDRRTYRGITHAVCNRRAGAYKANRVKRKGGRTSREW